MVAITESGLKDILKVLDALPEQIESAASAAVGDSAVALRRRILEMAIATTGLSPRAIESRMWINKASKPGRWFSRVSFSQQGIPVPEYRWKHEPTGRQPTRHRIRVGWPGGTKIAAGFVNPFGEKALPLTTRRKEFGLTIAIGPSLATLVAETFREPDLQRILEDLERQFATRLEEAD